MACISKSFMILAPVILFLVDVSAAADFLFPLSSADQFCRAQSCKARREQRQAERFWNWRRNNAGMSLGR
jgi:hypothetical protein